MTGYRLVIHSDAALGAGLGLEIGSVRLALLVADINMSAGVAELWRGDRLLARMRKRNGLHHPLWELA